MSGRLVGEVVGWLRTPAARALTVSERTVLLVIAERSNDETREMWGFKIDGVTQFEFLCEVVGVAPSGLTEILKKLASREINGRKGVLEVRIELGRTRAEKPVFAYRGRAMKFRLPELPASVALPESLGPDRPIPPAEPVDNTVDEPVDDASRESPDTPERVGEDRPNEPKGSAGAEAYPGKGRSQPTPNPYKQAPYKDHPYSPDSSPYVADEEDTPPATATPPATTSHHMGWDPTYTEARDFLFGLANEGQEFMDAAEQKLGADAPIALRVIHAAQAAHRAQEGIPA